MKKKISDNEFKEGIKFFSLTLGYWKIKFKIYESNPGTNSIFQLCDLSAPFLKNHRNTDVKMNRIISLSKMSVDTS